MIRHINHQNTITLDIEFNTTHSYHGLVCLFQISTWCQDFVIDPFILRQLIRNELKTVLENPEILKIVHGADYDLKLLQKEWKIFVFPAIDTQLVYQHLYPDQHHIGLKDLAIWSKALQNENDMQKDLQHADWRLRPLPKEFIQYAQNDTFHLFEIWEFLKKILFKDVTSNQHEAFYTSKLQMQKVHEFHPYDPHNDWKMIRGNPKVTLYPLFKKIANVRCHWAQMKDETPNNILHRDDIINIIIHEPTSIRRLKYMIPTSADVHTDEMEIILSILKNERKQEKEKVKSPIPDPIPKPKTKRNFTVTISNPDCIQQPYQIDPNQTFEEEMLEIYAPKDDIMQTTTSTPELCNRCHQIGHKGNECWEKRDKEDRKKFLKSNPASKALRNRKKYEYRKKKKQQKNKSI